MSIGRVVVDLLAKTGSFISDLDRAAKHAEKRSKQIDGDIQKMAKNIGVALGSVFSAKIAVDFTKSLIDGLDALNDYSDATGASIANLSALEDVAGRTGASMDTVSGILVKFNNVLKEADGKNAASQALKALGLNAEELKRIDPAEALRRTAVALSGFADDGNKARLIQELFGKSVKDAAAFLKDLSEQTALVGKTTSDQTQAAEDFNKSLFSLQKNAIDAGRALLKDLLPAMNEIIKAFNSGGLRGAIDEFGNQISDWAGNAQRKKISGLKDEIESLSRTVERAGRTPGEIVVVRPQDVEDLARLRAELKKTEQSYFKLNSAAGGGRGSVNPAFVEGRPSLPSVSAVKTPKKATESEFQKYMENLEKQLQKTKELGVEETVLADIQAGRLGKINAGEKTRVVDLGKQIDAAKAMTEYTKLSESAEQARTDGLLKATLEQEKQAQSLADGNKALREETELLGKSHEAQVAIEQARISSAISIKQEELARLAGTDAFVRESDAIREQITLLTERKDLVAQKGVAEKLADDAKKAEDFARQVGASFESSFEKAIIEGDKLSDVLKGLAKDLLALTIRQSITGPMASGIGKLLSGGSGLATTLANAQGGDALDNLLRNNNGFGTGGGWSSLFSGLGFADGGNPPVGKYSLVGENGPELFMPNTSGTIIPNHALGGGGQSVSVTINNTIGDVASASMVREAQAGTERRIMSQLRRSRGYAGEAA